MNFVQDLCEDLHELFKVNTFLVLIIVENEILQCRDFPDRADMQFIASGSTACSGPDRAERNQQFTLQEPEFVKLHFL